MKNYNFIVRAAAFLMVMALLASSFPFPPLSASAATDIDELLTQITAQPGLSATANPAQTQVTVSGSRAGAKSFLLSIPDGVTLNWEASISGSAVSGTYLINLDGQGTFSYKSGTISNSGAGGQINALGEGLTINIDGLLRTASNGITLNIAAKNVTVNVNSGGTIDNSGSNSAINVTTDITGAAININSGGSIISKPGGYAINDGGGISGETYANDTQITVYPGALVESGSACAIRSSGRNSVVTVQGGRVVNDATSNTNSTIYMNGGTITNVFINGGVVETINPSGTSYVIQTTGNTVVAGGRVTAISGRAINLVGMASTATITGGIVETDSGTAISTATTTTNLVENSKIIVTGGTVQATGSGTAIKITGAGSTAAISGGLVTAKQGLAVDASGLPAANSVTVSGGFVFAYGNATARVISPAAKLDSVSGSGSVVAWDTTTGEGLYSQNALTDLASLPGGGAKWDNDPPSAINGGIRYGTGPNDFYPLAPDVRVNQNLFILTIVNGTSGGLTSLPVEMGSSVEITINAALEYNPAPLSMPYYLVPINGSGFRNWSTEGGGSFGDSSNRTTTFTMPAGDVTVTANFSPYYMLQVSGGIIGEYGSPRSGHPDYDWFPEGTVVSIAPFQTYPSGLSFEGWNIGDTALVTPVGDGYNFDFQMPGRLAFVGAQPGSPISPSNWMLTVSGGMITTTTGGAAVGGTAYSGYSGTGLNIIASPPPAGQEFDRWVASPSGSGGVSFVPSNPEAVYTMPSQNATLTATYKTKTYTLTVDNGSGTFANLGSFAAGAVVAIAAAPPPHGMVFSGWTVISGGGEFLSDTSFVMPDSDAAISAHYEFIDHELLVVNGIDGFGTDIGRHHIGEVITIIADDPPEGMIFSGWKARGGGDFADPGSPTTTFTMPDEDATVTATWRAEGTPSENGSGGSNGNGNGDPGPSHPGDVSHILNTETHLVFVHGYGRGLFAPNSNMTRAEVAQMFYNLLIDHDIEITKTFPDIYDTAWFKPAVETLATLGIVQGRSDGRFHPNDAITRAEFVAMAVRFTHEELGSRQAMQFKDLPETHWAHEVIVTATSYGWIIGYPNGTFRPEALITRAEVVTLTNRLLGRSPDKAFIDEHLEIIFYTDVSATHWAYYEIEEASNTHRHIDHYDNGVTEEWVG